MTDKENFFLKRLVCFMASCQNCGNKLALGKCPYELSDDEWDTNKDGCRHHSHWRPPIDEWIKYNEAHGFDVNNIKQTLEKYIK